VATRVGIATLHGKESEAQLIQPFNFTLNLIS
jgi:hypothetical protein